MVSVNWSNLYLPDQVVVALQVVEREREREREREERVGVKLMYANNLSLTEVFIYMTKTEPRMTTPFPVHLLMQTLLNTGGAYIQHNTCRKRL